MKIKKVFEPIVAILTAALAANPKIRVSDVMDELNDVMKARVGEGGGGRATTFHKDEHGVVTAIRCFYFGKWFDPRVVETGLKANTPSGYNSMCKVGLNAWTKQQREAKTAKDDLLADVISGKIAQADLGAKMQEIEAAKAAVIATDLPLFDSIEDLFASQATTA